MDDLQAELYALTHRGNTGDAAFYARATRGAASVLELGCGAGRLLTTLSQGGKHVVGMELEPALLRLAKRGLRPGVKLIRGDMRNFVLQQRFDRIVIPYSGFYCLWKTSEALSCLRAVRRHLALSGRFVLDCYAAEAFHAHAAQSSTSDRELSFVTRIVHRGKRWDVFERSRWVRRHQRLDVTYIYVPEQGRRNVEVLIQQRYWLASQLPALLSRAGLKLIDLYGDFRGAPFRPSRSASMIAVAKLA